MKISIMSPVAQVAERAEVSAAESVESLATKTIALCWNLKSNGDIALAEIGRNLAEQDPTISIRNYTGIKGTLFKHFTNDQLDQIARECDVAIAATGD